MSIAAKWYWCQINEHKGCAGHERKNAIKPTC